MIALFTAIGPFLSLAVSIVGYFLGKKAAEENQWKEFIAFVELMDKHKLATLAMRRTAFEQRARVEALWATEGEKPSLP